MKHLTHTVTLCLNKRGAADHHLTWKVNDEPEAKVLRELLLSATPTPVVTISPLTMPVAVNYREKLEDYHKTNPPTEVEDQPKKDGMDGHDLDSHNEAVAHVRASLTDKQWADVSIVMAIQATSAEARELASVVFQYYQTVHDLGLDDDHSRWLKEEIVRRTQSSSVIAARKKVLSIDQDTDKPGLP